MHARSLTRAHVRTLTHTHAHTSYKRAEHTAAGAEQGSAWCAKVRDFPGVLPGAGGSHALPGHCDDVS
eukprot:scaffold239336_cov24-Tisochrysis_lutea.AAC.1